MINAFIPIKSYSERIKNKNFRLYKDLKLYTYIINSALNANCFDNIYIDTDSDEIKKFAFKLGCKIIDRKPNLASDFANGNDLIVEHMNIDSDFYFQLFATAPELKPESIKYCVDFLKSNNKRYDSIFTVEKDYGWYWFNNLPVNYRPSVLPRSQDAEPIIKETTGLYGITKESLFKYKCRIGARPYMYELTGAETKDIDWESDLK